MQVSRKSAQNFAMTETHLRAADQRQRPRTSRPWPRASPRPCTPCCPPGPSCRPRQRTGGAMSCEFIAKNVHKNVKRHKTHPESPPLRSYSRRQARTMMSCTSLMDAREGGEEGGGMMGGAVSQFWAVGARDRIWAEVGPCRWMAWPGKISMTRPATDEEESGCKKKMEAMEREICWRVVVVLLLAVARTFSAC